MATGSAPRSRGNRRRVHPAVGTAAAAMVAYQCLQPGANRLLHMPLTAGPIWTRDVEFRIVVRASRQPAHRRGRVIPRLYP
jgi:hypothetical protein